MKNFEQKSNLILRRAKEPALSLSKEPALSLSKGFTLLEILIATTIFSAMMVMTTGVISQGAKYQTKLSLSRGVSEESRKLSDLISTDIRTADTSFSVKASASDIVTGATQFENGLMLLSCDTSFVCTKVNYSSVTGTDNDPAKYTANVLVIRTKDTFKFYVSFDKAIYYKAISSSDLATHDFVSSDGTLYLVNVFSKSIVDYVQGLPGTKISDAGLEESINFSGYTATKAGPNYQSYILYYIHTKTADFDNLKPDERAEAYIRSMVASRSYSN